MRKCLLIAAFCIIQILSFYSFAHAAEIKIFDPLGLMRGFTKVKSTGQVSVTLKKASSPLPDSISLTNVDGLSTDRQLNKQKEAVYTSGQISPGSWKIVLPNSSLVVEEVKVSE